MALFIEAALNNPANPFSDTFTDSTAALLGPVVCGFIEKLADDEITGGCGGTNFCPNDPVSGISRCSTSAPEPLNLVCYEKGNRASNPARKRECFLPERWRLRSRQKSADLKPKSLSRSTEDLSEQIDMILPVRRR
jgi:hypothetical protein